MPSLIINGYHKDLTKDDVWQIEESEECQNLTERLEKVWNPLAERYINENRILNKLSDEQIAYQKSNGHRHQLTQLLVESIKAKYGNFNY